MINAGVLVHGEVSCRSNSSLMQVCLSHLEIKKLPAEFGCGRGWANVTTLLLNGNHLQTLPFGFPHDMTKLTTLALDDNRLQRLRLPAGSCSRLTDLALHDNPQLRSLSCLEGTNC